MLPVSLSGILPLTGRKKNSLDENTPSNLTFLETAFTVVIDSFFLRFYYLK